MSQVRDSMMGTARASVVILVICAFPLWAQRPDLQHPDPTIVAEPLQPAPPKPCNDCDLVTKIYSDARWFVTAPFAKYVGGAMLVVAILMAVWVWRTPHGEIPQFAIHRGEKVRWVGSPREGFCIYAVDIIRVPLSVVVAAVLISNVRAEGAFDSAEYDLSPIPILYVIVGSPLIAVAVYGLFGRFFDDARRRKRTIYAITNQRAITVVGKRMSWRMIRSLTGINVKQHLDGSASIYAHAPEMELDLRYAENENFRPRQRTGFEQFLANARGPEWQFGRREESGLLFERVQHAQLALEEIEAVKADPPPQLVG